MAVITDPNTGPIASIPASLDDEFPDYTKVVKPALEQLKERVGKGEDWLSERSIIVYSAMAPKEETGFLKATLQDLDLSRLTQNELAEMLCYALSNDNVALVDYILGKCEIDVTLLDDTHQKALFALAVEKLSLSIFMLFYQHKETVDIPKMITGLSKVLKEDFIKKAVQAIKANSDKQEAIKILLRLFDVMAIDRKPTKENHALAALFFSFVKDNLKTVRCLSDKQDIRSSELLQDMYFKEFHNRVIVGHIHGVRNRDFHYEGALKVNRRILRRVMKSMIAHYQEEESPYISPKEVEKMIAVLNHKDPDLHLIRTGFIRHASFVLLGKEYMVVCNRGPSDGNCTMKTYWIDSRKITPEIIAEIKELRHASKEDFFRTVYGTLPARLSPTGAKVKDDFCRAVENRAPKPQKVGNCYWAALKTAVRAGVALIKLSRLQDMKFAPILTDAYMFSKILSARLRMLVAEGYRQTEDTTSVLFDRHLSFIMDQKSGNHLDKILQLEGAL
jgi:hypothetical protein